LQVAEGLEVQADRALLASALEAMISAAGRDGAPVRAEATAAATLFLTVRGAPVPASALALPERGTVADPSGRPLGLALAAAPGRAQGAELRVEGGGLVLSGLARR
jgi:hypothetical protein